MANPLQKFFRQPKVFIKLPSSGSYSKPGTFIGDVNHLPVYGMTGMDEIITKTPDALLTGESTANVIKSCIPAINDPWELSIIDIVLILSAIRVATYGGNMHVSSNCNSCGEENDYDIDINKVIEHYMGLTFDGKVVMDDIVINLRPLNYKESTEFNVRSFKLQQQLSQASAIENQEEQQKIVSSLFNELAKIQAEIFLTVIESVEANNQIVTERSYIGEWLTNCEKAVYDAIKSQNEKNNTAWAMPTFPTKCDSCGYESNITVDLDTSSFFAQA